MLRYENVATEVIKVDLQNDFRVFGMALWDKENTCYKVTLYLQYANIDTLHMDLDHENIIFDESERKPLNMICVNILINYLRITNLLVL